MHDPDYTQGGRETENIGKQKAYGMFELGKRNRIKKLRVCTVRNPEAFARRFGGEGL